jgi:hypothetical protein
MLVIWVGALMVFGGLIALAAPPIWRARLSGRRAGAARAGDTLEPTRPGAGFGITRNWPGLILIVLGAILLLVAAVIGP